MDKLKAQYLIMLRYITANIAYACVDNKHNVCQLNLI